MFLTKNKLCLVVPLLPAPKALIGPGEEPVGFAGSPPGRLVCATSRGGRTGAPQAPPRERGAMWARPVRFPARRGLPLGYSPRLAHVFRGPRGFSPEVSEKSWERRREGVDSSARRVVEWSAVGRSVDTRASFPSFAWSVRPLSRTRARSPTREAHNICAARQSCEFANVREETKYILKKNIYYVLLCIFSPSSRRFLTFALRSQPTCELRTQVQLEGRFTLPKP